MPFGVPRSKTAVPDLPPWFVRRVPLLAALDRGAASALTLVCAPPGYGKTVLLADWVRGSGSPSAWVTVDEDDDDERLWAAVLAAVTTCPAVPPSSRLHRVVVAPGAVGPDVTSEVLEALEDLPVPIVLVIDDAHHLAGTQVLHTLHRVLRSRRARLRLVLVGRSDPALPVARLRLEDRLRAEQLAFSSENTTNLLEGCGVRLTPPQTELLHARTGGWAAGLRLAVLSLQDHPDPDRFLASFSGDERPVADYLVGEVLSRMAEDELTLLRWTSISDPLPPALAGHLSGHADAAGVLARLERDTGLVVGSGSHRTEYRVQELLRSYMSADLHRRGPALEERLHRQAAEWWDAQDRPVEALFHAARVGDESFRTQLLHRWAADLIGRGQHAELRRARGPDAEERTDPDPWTPLLEAQEHLAHGDRAAASDVLSRSPAGNPTGDPGSAYLRVATERLAGIDSPVAPDEPTPDDPALGALTLAGRGAARLFVSDPATADVQADLTGALRLARSRHLAFLELQCLCLLAAAALTAGDHRCASRRYRNLADRSGRLHRRRRRDRHVRH